MTRPLPLLLFTFLFVSVRLSAQTDLGSHLRADYRLTVDDYEWAYGDSLYTVLDFMDRTPDTPDRLSLQTMVADTYFGRGEYADALVYYESTDLGLLPDRVRDDATYRMAIAQLRTGRLGDAAVWLATLREVSPRYAAPCTYAMAYIDYARGRYSEALRGFSSLVGEPDYAALAPIYVAEIYLLQGDNDRAASAAADYLRRYGTSGARSGEMHRVGATVDYRRGAYAQAIDGFSKYVDNIPADREPRRDARYVYGLSCYMAGAYSRVPALLDPVANGATDALGRSARLHSGLASLLVGDKTRARLSLSLAAAPGDDGPTAEQAAYNYALLLLETDYSAFGEGVTAFETYLNRFPSSPRADAASAYLVEVYLNTRSYDAALQSINRIARPDDRLLAAKQKVLFQIGTQDYTNTRYDQAADHLAQSIALGQYDRAILAEAHYWLAETRYRQGRMTEADDHLTTYLQLATDTSSPTYALAYYNQGYIDFHARSYEAALGHFTRYLQAEHDASRTELTADAHNRAADCHLAARRFAEAEQHYAEAERLSASVGDYACYRLALVAGLTKDYDRKVRLLDRLTERYPTSPYAVTALYERGRAYVQSGRPTEAIAAYQTLLSRYPDSPLCPKAAAEIGLLYYQADQYSQAIDAYRLVVTRYPGSDEARMALRDLRSIYVDLNRVDEYAAMVADLPGGVTPKASERDSLTFVAAERAYIRGATDEARQSFARYVQTFNPAAYETEAYHYLYLMAVAAGSDDDTIAYADRLLSRAGSPYRCEVLAGRAAAYTRRADHAAALSDYRQLIVVAENDDYRLAGLTGALRAAVAIDDREETVRQATALLSEAKLTPELRQEALYRRAKAYIAAGAPARAADDLAALSSDTRTAYGAESRFLVAQLLYDEGKTAEAEQSLLDFIDQSTPHAYWLARAFILLADLYAADGRTAEARQYLLSLQQNYDAPADIAAMIDERLANLQ